MTGASVLNVGVVIFGEIAYAVVRVLYIYPMHTIRPALTLFLLW